MLIKLCYSLYSFVRLEMEELLFYVHHKFNSCTYGCAYVIVDLVLAKHYLAFYSVDLMLLFFCKLVFMCRMFSYRWYCWLTATGIFLAFAIRCDVLWYIFIDI